MRNWRNLNTQNQASAGNSSVPAAALLFQAPEFAAPVFQQPSRKERSAESPAESAAATGQDQPTQKAGQKSKAKQAPVKTDEGKGQDPGDSPAADKDKNAAKNPSKGSSKSKSKGKKGSKASGKQDQPDDAAQKATEDQETTEAAEAAPAGESTARRRRRRTRSADADPVGETTGNDQVQALQGSTRLEAKRMRRREGRRESRRRQSLTEAEFLARREAVDREMIVRHQDGADQIAVLEDGILVEHFVARRTAQSIVGNIYLGRVQNVLPSMEAAFVDIGRGRNAVLYAGEVNWDVLGMEGKPRRIETALKSGDAVMVQVTKDPIGHKGARLTSQITLAGRYLVFVPGSSMLGISRKLPDNERARLKKLLREIVPADAGVIVRTAAEGASEEQLRDDVERLVKQWRSIEKKAENTRKAPVLLRGEPELVVRVVRDLFNEDFRKLVVQGNETWDRVHEYVDDLSPELSDRLEHWTSKQDVFQAKKVQQQLSKAMDRKVWLPSGGTLIIERTEALTVVDVNTGKFVGSGGTLEETVTRNNLEAAEEIVRQLRLRDIGGIVIIDFVDMVLESNRELVLRRLVECLGRDRTRHQVTEITSLGLVQMTRKRVGEGLVEAFSTPCDVCEGRGFIVHDHPVEHDGQHAKPSRKSDASESENRAGRHSNRTRNAPADEGRGRETHVGDEKVRSALSAIAAATRGQEEAEEQRDEAVAAPEPSERADSGNRPAQSREETPEQPSGTVAERKAAEVAPRRKSVLDIALPQATGVKRKPDRARRVATRAAGSPPSHTAPSHDDASESGRDKHQSAIAAVRELFEEVPSSGA